MIRIIGALFLVLLSSFASGNSPKERIVFLVNTAAEDERGGNIPNAPYLNEAKHLEDLKNSFPNTKIIRIRADSNRELKKLLDLWMQPDPGKKEIAGLLIHAHGNRMIIENESGQFQMQLPSGIAETFSPIIGRFSKEARIHFTSCSILDGMSEKEAGQAMQKIADAFQLESGVVYANKTISMHTSTTLKHIDVFDKDIDGIYRKIKMTEAFFWPLALAIEYYWDHVKYNQGYLLRKKGSESELYESDYYSALKPTVTVQKNVKATSPSSQERSLEKNQNLTPSSLKTQTAQ